MRTILICLAVIFLAIACYAYAQNPAGCEKVLNDVVSVVSSVSPISLHSDTSAPIAPLIQGKLISADGSPFSFPANAPETSLRYYAIYYSAQWCPPCHAFTPVLVEWYRKFKPSHPNFEIIFVSEDHEAASMLAYMKEMAMPWPAIRHSDLIHDGNGTFKGSGIEKFAGSSIPDLVLVDADGKVLSDSFSWTGSYLGPQHVLDDIEKLVSEGTPTPKEPSNGANSEVVNSSLAVMPCPPHWIWKTLDGKTFQEVVVNKFEPDRVTISYRFGTDLAGCGTGPIYLDMIPPDIMKILAPYQGSTQMTLPPPSKRWAPPEVMPSLSNWTWDTSDGTKYQNVVVTKIEPDNVSILHSSGVANLPIHLLSPDIQKKLNYDIGAASQMTAARLSQSPIAIAINGKLISSEGTNWRLSAPIQYYAIYFSARWCMPCCAFTPQLVKWYNGFKPTHRNFELIFVSDDKTETAMFYDMKINAMPWPAIRYSDREDSRLFSFAGSGIPDLILIDSNGKILSDTNRNHTYVGPQAVVADIENLVPASGVTPNPAMAASATALVSPPASVPQTAVTLSSSNVFKPSALADVLPAQPNWTWTTSDDKTYQNVIVTKIEPDTVSITHAMGVAHIPINLLPPDIQKKLNYDPATAAVAHAERERELTHPYYAMASLAEAQNVARQLRRPLAWMCGHLVALDTPNPPTGSEDALTQMAVNRLKSQAVVVFLDGNADLPALSPIIRDQQFFQFDDGPVPGGHHFYAPKIVFSDADITRAFGRVSCTQMKAGGASAIDEILASISKDANAARSPSAPVTTVTPSISTAATAPSPDAFKPWAPPDVMPAQLNWTWTTSEGKTFQNVVVTRIEADTVSISHSMGAAHIPINLLPPDIQKLLNYDPHAASQLTALISGKLVSADGTAANAPGASVQYYAIYYSAQWCPPCHAFTPLLVKWYNKFKPAHPNFELIFVSDDHSEASMFAYMKEMTMPWPAVRFGELKHDGSGIEKFAGSGIPDLVLVNANGKVLSDSYHSGTYVGPQAVVDDINKLVGGSVPVPLVRQTPSAPAFHAARSLARILL